MKNNVTWFCHCVDFEANKFDFIELIILVEIINLKKIIKYNTNI